MRHYVPEQLKKHCFKKGQCPSNYNRVGIICSECGIIFMVSPSKKEYIKCCSRKCLGIKQSKDRKGKFGVGETNPMYKNGISLYRTYVIKKKCSICKQKDTFLEIHHKDNDRTNNKNNNLQVICRGCHKILHGQKRSSISGRFI